MIRFLPLVLLCGCVITHDPQPADTKFNENDRDWLEVYRHELKVAVDNEDIDAYNFFFEEYMRERVRQLREKQGNAE